MLAKEVVCLLLLGLSLAAAVDVNLSGDSSRFYIKKDRPPGFGGGGGGQINRRSGETPQPSARRESSFDPDVLNRFLEEYASKIKRTTERPMFGYDEDTRVPQESQDLEAVPVETDDKDSNATRPQGFREPARFNDTSKRHKLYGANPPTHNSDDRSSGWVTLDAIPWSKSKISKWQANPTTQGPWPDSINKWDTKPGFNKPWNSDYPTRPASSYESNKPWQNKLTQKPHWDNVPSGSNKPWYSDGTRPNHPERPSYPAIDKYEDNPNQAQKWPPERPSWDRPSLDIDNGPPNFPSNNNNNNWERPGSQRPSYTHHMESYVSEPGGWNDRNDFPSNSKYRPDENYYDRPHFSHYNYPASGGVNNAGLGAFPPSHPSSGDGQWVLLSTNRGYSKSRQRSIKLDALVNTDTDNKQQQQQHHQQAAPKKPHLVPSNEENVPAVTSKRQIRLTVLPSINGTNTTTSHGGLLEVERTFKTVDQSQKEYEREKNGNNGTIDEQQRPNRPFGTKILVNKRPIRNTLIGGGPVSSSAVLAAVGAGMLPATMAMMIPMMLGRRRRRKRSLEGPAFISLPVDALVVDVPRRRRRI